MDADLPVLGALRSWLNSWRGIGDVERGMARQGYDLQAHAVRREGLAGNLLHQRDGALTDERDRYRVGTHAVARGPERGVGGAEEGRCAVMRTLLAALILAGCASVPLADSAQDAASKAFAVPSGRALIYVVRDGGYVSGAYQLFRISLDRRDHGALADGTYYVFAVDPGLHSVAAAGNENQERVQIQANAGGVYFVSVRLRIGMTTARVSVSLPADDIGKAAVRASKMAASG